MLLVCISIHPVSLQHADKRSRKRGEFLCGWLLGRAESIKKIANHLGDRFAPATGLKFSFFDEPFIHS